MFGQQTGKMLNRSNVAFDGGNYSEVPPYKPYALSYFRLRLEVKPTLYARQTARPPARLGGPIDVFQTESLTKGFFPFGEAKQDRLAKENISLALVFGGQNLTNPFILLVGSTASLRTAPWCAGRWSRSRFISRPSPWVLLPNGICRNQTG